MTYYDHATAMACKLDQWSEQRSLRNFELEALDREQCMSESGTKKQPLYWYVVSVIRSKLIASG